MGLGDVPDVGYFPILTQCVPSPEHVAEPVGVDRVVERWCSHHWAEHDARADRYADYYLAVVVVVVVNVVALFVFAVVVADVLAELVEHGLAVPFGPAVGILHDFLVVGHRRAGDGATGGSRAGIDNSANCVLVLGYRLQEPLHRYHVALVHCVVVRIIVLVVIIIIVIIFGCCNCLFVNFLQKLIDRWQPSLLVVLVIFVVVIVLVVVLIFRFRFPEVIIGAEIPRDVKDIATPVAKNVVVGTLDGHVGDADLQNSTGGSCGLGCCQGTEVIYLGGDIGSNTGPYQISVFQEIPTQVRSNEAGRPRDGGNWS